MSSASCKKGDAVGGDFAEDADGESGAGEWLALEDVFGHAEVAADFADFVFEEVFERLDELELHALGQASDVVVALDGLRGAAHGLRLDDVGIERALHEPVDLALGFGDAAGFLLEDGDEFFADDLALLLGVFDLGELAEEEVGGVNGVDVEAKLAAQVLLHFLKFVFAQDSVVDEDAGELVADGAMDEDGSDGGIDAAGESADHAAVADLFADGFDGFVDEALRRPVGSESADVEDEVAQDDRSLPRMVDFGMELHGVELARRIFEGGLARWRSARRDGSRAEALRLRRRATSRRAWDW